MAEELIISVSGLRGIIGANLTPAIAAEYGCAFGTFLQDSIGRGEKRPTVCIGRDSRPSGQMLKSAVIAGLTSAGVDVIDLDLATTPGVGVMVGHLKCSGGVIITASHNPAPYNGIKLLLGNRMAPPPDCAAQIRQYFVDRKFSFVDSAGCGSVKSTDLAGDVHIGKVLALVDCETIRKKRFKVVLDSVNGAGGPVTGKLLTGLGCEVFAINSEPTGIFVHTPEPTAANLTGLCDVVKQKKAHIGFAQDPDADRLAIVDENGNYIGEEYTLALATEYILSKKSGTVATNLSTSRMIDDIAAGRGAVVIRTPVGEANVAAAMLEHKCVIGGEGNGGVIDLRVGPIRDSLVGIVLVLQLMAESGKTVSELVRQIGGYVMTKDKFPADRQQAEQILSAARKLFADAKVDSRDGLRFDFGDGWLHLRTSNTEPVMRVILEATDKHTADKYIEAVKQICREVMGAV